MKEAEDAECKEMARYIPAAGYNGREMPMLAVPSGSVL